MRQRQKCGGDLSDEAEDPMVCLALKFSITYVFIQGISQATFN